MQFFELKGEERVLCYFAGDSSNAYDHKVSNWAFYLENTLIKTPKFSITMEIVNRWGDYAHIHFERVLYAHPITRVISMANVNQSWVLVPDFERASELNFHIETNDIPRMVAPREFAHMLYTYAVQRDDARFSFSALYCYARSISNKITIAKKVVRLGVTLEAKEFDTITMNVIICAAIARGKRMNIIGKTFKRMGDEFKDPELGSLQGPWNKFVHWFTHILEGVNAKKCHPRPEGIDERITHARIESFPEYITSDIYATDLDDLPQHIGDLDALPPKKYFMYRGQPIPLATTRHRIRGGVGDVFCIQNAVGTGQIQGGLDRFAVLRGTALGDLLFNVNRMSAHIIMPDKQSLGMQCDFKLQLKNSDEKYLNGRDEQEVIVDWSYPLTLTDIDAHIDPADMPEPSEVSWRHYDGTSPTPSERMRARFIAHSPTPDNHDPQPESSVVSEGHDEGGSALSEQHVNCENDEDGDEDFEEEEECAVEAEYEYIQPIRAYRAELEKNGSMLESDMAQNGTVHVNPVYSTSFRPIQFVKATEEVRDVQPQITILKRGDPLPGEKIQMKEFVPVTINHPDAQGSSAYNNIDFDVPVRGLAFSPAEPTVGQIDHGVDLTKEPSRAEQEKILDMRMREVEWIIKADDYLTNRKITATDAQIKQVAIKAMKLSSMSINAGFESTEDVILKRAVKDCGLDRDPLSFEQVLEEFDVDFSEENINEFRLFWTAASGSTFKSREEGLRMRITSALADIMKMQLEPIRIDDVAPNTFGRAMELDLSCLPLKDLDITVSADEVKMFRSEVDKSLRAGGCKSIPHGGEKSFAQDTKGIMGAPGYFYPKFLLDAHLNMRSRIIREGTYKFKTLLGVPSAGKTTLIKEFISKVQSETDKQHKILVVCPTRKLCDSYKEVPCTAMTFHKAMSVLDQDFSVIIIDEAPIFHKSFWVQFSTAGCPIILLGDPLQITHIQFVKGVYGRSGKLDQRLPFEYSLTECQTVPQDACRVLGRSGYDDYNGITTKSPIKKSIKFCSFKEAINKYKNHYWMSFTRNSTEFVRSKLKRALGDKVSTVHTAQGQRIDRAVLYVTGDALPLLCNMEHCRVAISRHKTELVIVDEGGYLNRYLKFDDTDLGVLADVARIPTFAPNTPQEPAAVIKEVMEVPKPSNCLDPVAIETILDMITPAPTNDDALVQINHPLPDVDSGVWTADRGLENETHTQRRNPIAGTRFRGRTYEKNNSQTIRAMLGRYALLTKVIPEEQIPNWLNRLKLGLSKFVDIEALSAETRKSTFVERVSTSFHEYLTALKDRDVDPSKAFDIDLTETDRLSAISFFNKAQFKHDFDPDAMAKDKVGQGVSPWTKTMNALISAYVRCIHTSMEEHSKEQVLWANGQDEHEFSKHMQVSLDSAGVKHGDYQTVCNDFSQFDASQNNLSLALDCWLLELGGAPGWVQRMYHAQRSRWRLNAHNIGGGTLDGSWKKHSGEPGTLTFNTSFNIAAIGTILDFDVLYWAGFKGDDSIVMASNIRPVEDFNYVTTANGWNLKLEFPVCPEFIGYFITPYGFFPDLPRYIAKLHMKSFHDRKHLEEALVSFSGRVGIVRNMQAWSYGLAYVAEHYGLQLCNVEALWNYMAGAHNNIKSFKLSGEISHQENRIHVLPADC